MGIEYILLVFFSGVVLNFVISPFTEKQNFKRTDFLFFGAIWLLGVGMGYIICNLLNGPKELAWVLGLAILGSEHLVNELWSSRARDQIVAASEEKFGDDFFDLGRAQSSGLEKEMKEPEDSKSFPKVEQFGEKGPGL